MLLTLNGDGKIVPSAHAQQAKAAGLEIITWTLEAGDPRRRKLDVCPIHNLSASPSETLQVLHVLAKDVACAVSFQIGRVRSPTTQTA